MTCAIKIPTHLSYIADGERHIVPFSMNILSDVLAKELSFTIGHLAKSGLYIVDVLFDKEMDEVIIYDYNGVPQRRLKK